MSTTAVFVDPDYFKTLMHKFRTTTEIDWILAGHDSYKLNEISVINSGTGGPDAVLPLLEDDQTFYYITKVVDIIDNNKMDKFVYVHWIGPQVPFVKLGRLGVLHGSIINLFQPHHDYIESSNKDILTEESLVTRIRETSGSKSKVVEGETDPSMKVNLLVRGTSYTNASTSPVSAAEPVTRRLSVTNLTSIDSLAISQDAHDIINDILSSHSEFDWCLVKYSDRRCKGPLIAHEHGSGGITELTSSLTEDNVYYGIVTFITLVDNSIKIKKYVSITYIGSEIPVMAKAIIGTHRSVIERLLGSCHGSIYATDKKELNERNLRERIIDATSTQK